MRILHLHCDHVEYTPTKKEIPAAEDIDPKPGAAGGRVGGVRGRRRRADDAAVASQAVIQGKGGHGAAGLPRGCCCTPTPTSARTLAPARTALEVMEKMSEYAADVESHRSAFWLDKNHIR